MLGNNNKMNKIGPTERIINRRKILRRDIKIKNNENKILECSHFI